MLTSSAALDLDRVLTQEEEQLLAAVYGELGSEAPWTPFDFVQAVRKRLLFELDWNDALYDSFRFSDDDNIQSDSRSGLRKHLDNESLFALERARQRGSAEDAAILSVRAHIEVLRAFTRRAIGLFKQWDIDTDAINQDGDQPCLIQPNSHDDDRQLRADLSYYLPDEFRALPKPPVILVAPTFPSQRECQVAQLLPPLQMEGHL